MEEKYYIVISELPQEQQKPFARWIWGQTVPVVENENENKNNCAYKQDYDSWLHSWQQRKIARVAD